MCCSFWEKCINSQKNGLGCSTPLSAVNSNSENFESSLYMKSASMPFRKGHMGKHCTQAKHQEEQNAKRKQDMPQRNSSKTIEIMTRQELLLPDASSPTDDTQNIATYCWGRYWWLNCIAVEVLATTVITYLLLMEVLVTLEVLLFTTVVGPTDMTDRSIDDALVLLSIANGRLVSQWCCYLLLREVLLTYRVLKSKLLYYTSSI